MGLIFKEGFSFSGYERNGLFMNVGGERFKDISGVSGVDSILDGRSTVVGDFDNDGDSDLFVVNIQGDGHLLFRNNRGQESPVVRVTLEGSKSGRDAFGTIVHLKTSNGIQTRIASGGNGFLAHHDPRLLFGLGEAKEAEWIEVLWPSGSMERYGPIAAGSSLKIAERSGERSGRGDITYRETRLPDPLDEKQAFWNKLAIQKGGALPGLSLNSISADGDLRPTELSKETNYLVNFWATFCGPCRKEMRELQQLYPKLLREGVQLVGISLDTDPSSVLRFADRLGVSYPLMMLKETDLGKIWKRGEAFIPLSVVTDSEGKVVDAFEGWNAESERRIRALFERSHP